MAEEPKTDMFAATINSVAPEATTASLAAAVPVEHTTKDFVHDETISSVAPESSTAELAAEVPKVVSTPGTNDVPGGFPETPATEIAEPTPIIIGEQVFSVKPFPASDTPTNPFHLEPGEPIPQNEFTTADINRHVKLDEESYERADASNLGFGLGGAPVLPEVVTPAALREAEGRGVLDIPEPTANMIPESSLPITSFAAATVAPEVPEIVKESQEKANVEPEASAVPEVVELKKELEEELKTEVPVIPETETVKEKEDSDAPAVATATTVGGIMAAAGIASASGEPNDETTPAVVPEIVRDSQKIAHAEPEASAVEEAVEAKREVEEELRKEVHTVAPVTLNGASAKPVAEVPVIVQKSLAESSALPEATAVTEAVELKKEVEDELKEEVKPTEAVAPTPLSKDAPLTVPSKAENGVALNGNGTSTKSEKEAEANGNGIKSPKKSFENGESGELKKKRRSLFGSLKEFFHSGTGSKDKGKAKGEISP